MECRVIQDLKEGDVLANLGPIQHISEYANCWVISVRTDDNVNLAMKYSKFKVLIIENQ